MTEEEKRELFEEDLRQSGMTREEFLQAMYDRISGADASELIVTPPGQTPPPVGPVKAKQFPWEDELSDQLGERQ